MNNRVHQGHLARKRFGQNFLNDQFVIDSIVSAINPQKGQAMVEIGPGLAALTEPVGERLDQLTVIELDRDLAARLQTHPFLGPKPLTLANWPRKWASRCVFSATCLITSPRR